MITNPDVQPKAEFAAQLPGGPEAMATRHHALMLARYMGAICSRAGMSPASVSCVKERFVAALRFT